MSKEGEKKKVAVVLSGGGANGAYEVGVLKALLSGKSPTTGYEPLEPDIFVGTSIGSFNAACLVSNWDRFGSAAVFELEKMWLDQIAGDWRTNGVFRLRVNPLEYVDVRSYTDPGETFSRFGRWLRDGGAVAWEGVQRGVHFLTSKNSLEQRIVQTVDLPTLVSTEPMHHLLSSIDYEPIRNSSKWLKIAATNWSTGELRMFWNRDMTDDFGPRAVAASAAIPGFFPPVEYGSQLFVDGCVLLNTPLRGAVTAGADVIHVIYLDPKVKNIPFAELRNTYDTMIRMMQITWAASYNHDIAAAERINRELADERDRPEGKKRRPLTIYRYHPHDPLEGDLGFLNFKRERVTALIRRGFEDAVSHDWQDAGDILPEGVTPPARPFVRL